jgi:hypothetical protein
MGVFGQPSSISKTMKALKEPAQSVQLEHCRVVFQNDQMPHNFD